MKGVSNEILGHCPKERNVEATLAEMKSGKDERSKHVTKAASGFADSLLPGAEKAGR